MTNKRTREAFRTDGDEWYGVQVEWDGKRLSITGSYGEYMAEDDARRNAYEGWVDYFDGDDEAFGAFVKRFSGISTVEEAARYVLDSDGEFHGLDVDPSAPGRDGYVAIGTGYGCVHDTIRAHFPELAPLIAYHLNDMTPGTPAQMAELDNWYKANPDERHSYELSRTILASRDGDDTEVDGFGKGNMLVDNGYLYGSAWLTAEIPADVMALADAFLTGGVV